MGLVAGNEIQFSREVVVIKAIPQLVEIQGRTKVKVTIRDPQGREITAVSAVKAGK